jgi:hypothetical protein
MTDRIEPALTRDEWTKVLEDITDAALHLGWAEAEVQWLTTERAGLLALTNHLLPDSDPRKIRRRHVVALRSVLHQNPDKLPGYGEPLQQLCEALDAILPPPKNDWEKGSLYGVPPEGS